MAADDVSAKMKALSLELLPGRFAVCQLAAGAGVPDWAGRGTLTSVTRTGDELSIVCDEAAVSGDVKCDRGWRCLKLQGPLDLDLTGVLTSVLEPLAVARISIFAVSTFDTDYVLVRGGQLEKAVAALRAAGHIVE